MTQAQINRIKKAKAEINKSVKVIAKERDRLRKYVSDIEDILETVEGGIGELEYGVDRLSELL
jgi:predicted  nucleic acid-binding Zn-ribbon protein